MYVTFRQQKKSNRTAVQNCCINKPRFLKNGVLFFNLIVFNKSLQNSCDFSPCCIIFRCKDVIVFTLRNTFFATVFHRLRGKAVIRGCSKSKLFCRTLFWGFSQPIKSLVSALIAGFILLSILSSIVSNKNKSRYFE